MSKFCRKTFLFCKKIDAGHQKSADVIKEKKNGGWR
jgi:hypothetical protein